MKQRLNQMQPLWLVAALAMQVSATAFAQVTVGYVNFEGKQTNPVRLSPDGTRLFAVNTPDARLSVFDVSNPSNPILIAEIPVGIEPVSVNPLSNDEAWVVNGLGQREHCFGVTRHCHRHASGER
jgi:YVTN family beta-propeller protein